MVGFREIAYKKIDDLFLEISKKVIWQQDLIRDTIITLFSKWHILIEWAPGLAKTLTVDSLAKTLNLDFNRIQFTPDLLPSDLIWAKIYHPDTKSFWIKKWPLFSNFVLADEINRAPSKVQSALLEAMAERQISIWDETFSLEEPFIILATQNPIEQEWTFNLPEAQLDRFLLKTVVNYPNEKEELEILKNIGKISKTTLKNILTKEDIFKIQELVENISVDDKIFSYIKNIIFFTRKNPKIQKYLLYPVSPRGSISILQAAKAHAFLQKRDFVIPEDIKTVAFSCLRHRIALNFEALASGITPDEVIKNILDNVEIK